MSEFPKGIAHSHFWGGPVKKSKIHKTSKAVLTKCLPDKTSADLFFIGWSTSRHFPSYSRICISVYPHVLMEDNALHILLAVYKTVFFFIFGRFPCTGVRIMHVGAPLCGFGERHRWRGKWAVLPAPVPSAATYLLLLDVAPPIYSSWMLPLTPTFTYSLFLVLFS